MSTKIDHATAEERMSALGIELPSPPLPLGAYVEAVQTGNLLFLSGTLPVESGIPRFQGRIGGGLSVDDGSELLRSVFGSDKTSTRMVYGTNSLPAGVCVVVELALEVGTTAAL